MREKDIRLWIMLGFGAIAAYYIFRNRSAVAAITPIAPQNLAPISLPGINTTGAPDIRGSYTS